MGKFGEGWDVYSHIQEVSFYAIRGLRAAQHFHPVCAGTLRVLFGLRNVPLLAVMCVAPLQVVHSEVRQPSMDIVSSWFSIPASREMRTLGGSNPLFAALDPTTGIASGEECTSLLTWF